MFGGISQVKAQFKRRSTANNVELYIPVPEDADSPKFRVSCQPSPDELADPTQLTLSSPFLSQASVGTVHYVPEKSAFVWKIKQLAGGKEYLMRAQFGLPSVRGGTCYFTCGCPL